MLLDGMDGAFRQSDVSLCFVLGLLSWSDSLAGIRASLKPANASGPSEWAPREPPGTEVGLLLLLGLISFDATLRAALARAGSEVPPAPGPLQHGFEPLNLGR